MRNMLKIQEPMDLRLDQRDEELCQLPSQSQVDGAQLAALSLQMQELISSVESRAEVVGRDLEEINGWFDRHRGEINCLKIREKDAKEEVERLKGFVVGAGHEAQVFKNRLDRMEENVCRCGWTPSEVGEEFVSSEDESRTGVGQKTGAGLRMRVGQNCPMHLSERRSILLLLWRTPFLSWFQLQQLAALGPPLLFLSWKRSPKSPPSL